MPQALLQMPCRLLQMLKRRHRLPTLLPMLLVNIQTTQPLPRWLHQLPSWPQALLHKLVWLPQKRSLRQNKLKLLLLHKLLLAQLLHWRHQPLQLQVQLLLPVTRVLQVQLLWLHRVLLQLLLRLPMLRQALLQPQVQLLQLVQRRHQLHLVLLQLQVQLLKMPQMLPVLIKRTKMLQVLPSKHQPHNHMRMMPRYKLRLRQVRHQPLRLLHQLLLMHQTQLVRLQRTQLMPGT
jgi:hypothetical protein